MLHATVINYGVGNLFSVSNTFGKLGFEVEIRETPTGKEDVVILPGVGSFNTAINRLGVNKYSIIDSVKSGVSILGICLGMQLFFERSEEGICRGLGLLRGEVMELPNNVKKPHIGWNILKVEKDSGLLQEIGENPWVYFNHSYYPEPLSPDIISAKVNYGVEFTAVVEHGNIWGTQFHPEKSGKTGLRILENLRKILKR